MLDRPGVLRLCVVGSATLVALAGILVGAICELDGRPAPPWIAGVVGTALGSLTGVLSGLNVPAPRRPPGAGDDGGP